jgi:hypothetical protein
VMVCDLLLCQFRLHHCLIHCDHRIRDKISVCSGGWAMGGCPHWKPPGLELTLTQSQVTTNKATCDKDRIVCCRFVTFSNQLIETFHCQSFIYFSKMKCRQKKNENSCWSFIPTIQILPKT